jgi:acetyl esterase/lipase
MAAALKQHQVPHQFIEMKGFGHGFDVFPDNKEEPTGLKHPKVAEAFEKVLVFLEEQVGR